MGAGFSRHVALLWLLGSERDNRRCEVAAGAEADIQPKRVDLLHTRAMPLPEFRARHELCVDCLSTPPRLRMQGLCHSIYNNMQV